MTLKEKGAVVDPITLSVVWNKLLTITRECGERVLHSAQGPIMALARDLGPVILTPEAEIVSTAEFLVAHTLVAEIPTRHILDKFGELDPGDMVLANDGHIIQSGHLPDWTYLVPIYWHDELVYYGHFRGHAMDTGGAYSGSYFPRAYDCIAEGLNIPPVKIIKEGRVNEEIRELILDNVRTPAGVWADFMLIRGSLLKMQDDICKIIDKYGLDTVKACNHEIIKRDEVATREQIRAIPDGVYYGESAADWDGTTPDKQVWVRVKLTVKGDEMTFDFSDSDDQVDFINSPLGNTHAYTYAALFLVLDPSVSHNHGATIPVHIIAPPGKVVNPTRPHTYGACGCTCAYEISEACFKALGQAIPEQAMACTCRHFCAGASGRLPIIDPRTGHELEYFQAPFIEEGGSGALKGYDGWDGVSSAGAMGALKRGSIEEQELVFPVRFDVFGLHPDSEGPGEFIGARGTYTERVCTAPPGARTILQTGMCDGETYPPYGLAGAPPAPLGSIHIWRAGEKKEGVIKTIDMYEIYPGDVLITKTMGGGGWGDPLDRDAERVEFNVREGTLSFERARDVYGVILTQKDKDDPETIEVDSKATGELREKLKASKAGTGSEKL